VRGAMLRRLPHKNKYVETALQLVCVCVCALCGEWRTTQGATEPLQQPELCE
jgi:hypothetical protein